MTGPEHYRRAEALLAYQQQPAWVDTDDQGRTVECYPTVDEDDVSRNALMAAQIHATLALAAATMDVAGATSNGVVSPGWSEAIS